MAHGYGKCSLCKGEVKEKRVSVDFRWGKDLVVIEDVPAGVCEQCGEKYFTAKVSKKMEKLALAKIKAKRSLKVPVMEFKQAV